MADDKDNNKKTELKEDDAEKKDESTGEEDNKKDEDGDEEEGSGINFDEDDAGKEDEEAIGQVKAGVGKAFTKVKEAMQTIVKVIKWLIKLVAKLIEAGPPGWIVLLVIFVIVIVLILVASFTDEESNGDMSGNRSTYDTQDLINDKSFTQRVALAATREATRIGVMNELGRDQYEQMRNDLLDYENEELNVYDDNLWSYYNEDYGFQILSDEASQLLLPERLTYSYSHTDWTPDYDYNHELENQIIMLEEEIAANENTWPKIKTQKKKQELEDLKLQEMKLELKTERYKEINRMYWDYITTNFIENEEVLSKVHPDDEPVEEKILSFYKDKYGVDTEEVESELNYYHTVMKRSCKYERKISSTSGAALESFLKTPDWKKEDKTLERDYGTSLQDVEGQFKVKYELLHHEAVLNSIRNNHIVNDILMQSWSKQFLKDSLFEHMPIFEYYTYHADVPVKTFNEYEMYDEAYWDENGKYVDDGTFDSTIELYLKGGEYDIDYSDVTEAQYLTIQKEYYESQIAEQGTNGKEPDQILINELEIEIEKIDERLAELGEPEVLNEEYKETFAKFLEASVYNKDGERVLNPHNHNVKLDKPTTQWAYIPYGSLMLDSYVENTTVTETITISVSGQGTRTCSDWRISSFQGGKDAGPRNVTSITTADTVQSSLKPSKIRSILNSADYTYEKQEERNWKVEEKLDELRPDIPWYERDVSYSVSGGGTEYKHTTTFEIHNYGKMIPHVAPYDTNEDMLLVNSTYLSDFYGQTKLLTEESELVTDGLVNFSAYGG